MRKTPRSGRPDVNMRAEYRFDYSRAKTNRFASRMRQPVVAVVLESDVAAVFDSAAKVNKQLRATIAARQKRKASPRAPARGRRAG